MLLPATEVRLRESLARLGAAVCSPRPKEGSLLPGAIQDAGDALADAAAAVEGGEEALKSGVTWRQLLLLLQLARQLQELRKCVGAGDWAGAASTLSALQETLEDQLHMTPVHVRKEVRVELAWAVAGVRLWRCLGAGGARTLRAPALEVPQPLSLLALSLSEAAAAISAPLAAAAVSSDVDVALRQPSPDCFTLNTSVVDASGLRAAVASGHALAAVQLLSAAVKTGWTQSSVYLFSLAAGVFGCAAWGRRQRVEGEVWGTREPFPSCFLRLAFSFFCLHVLIPFSASHHLFSRPSPFCFVAPVCPRNHVPLLLLSPSCFRCCSARCAAAGYSAASEGRWFSPLFMLMCCYR